MRYPSCIDKFVAPIYQLVGIFAVSNPTGFFLYLLQAIRLSFYFHHFPFIGSLSLLALAKGEKWLLLALRTFNTFKPCAAHTISLGHRVKNARHRAKTCATEILIYFVSYTYIYKSRDATGLGKGLSALCHGEYINFECIIVKLGKIALFPGRFSPFARAHPLTECNSIDKIGYFMQRDLKTLLIFIFCTVWRPHTKKNARIANIQRSWPLRGKAISFGSLSVLRGAQKIHKNSYKNPVMVQSATRTNAQQKKLYSVSHLSTK